VSELSHLDREGRARMVDVGDKSPTDRRARAEAWVEMQPETLAAIVEGRLPKGDLGAVVRVAGVMAAKETSRLIPLCHPLPLSKISVDLEIPEPPPEGTRLRIVTEARCTGPTGVEMEALTAAGVAALTVYDMCKAIDRGMTITRVRLLEKTGGKSDYVPGGQ